MSWVGKNSAAILATTMCIALAFSIIMPFSAAQGADTTPPVTNASVAGTTGDNGWYKEVLPSVTLTAADDGSGVASTFYRLDNGAFTAYTASFTVPEGQHTVVFYSVDNAGNTEPTTTHNYLTVNVDTWAPKVNMTLKGNMTAGGYYNTSVTMNLTVSDNGSGISSTAYSLNRNSSPGVYDWKPYTGNVTIPDGQYTIYWGCRDVAGNAYNNSTGINIFNPTLTFSPETNKWYDDYFSFSIIMPDNVGKVEYSIDLVNWFTYNPSSTYVNWEGNQTFFYRATGKAGEVGEIHSLWYGIDKYGPSIGIRLTGTQSSSGWFDSDITVYLDANDNGSISLIGYSLDGTHWNNFTNINKKGSTLKFVVPKQNSKTIYFRTADMKGREASGSAFLYFAPGGYSQGSMSNSVWIDGVLYGPSTGPSTGGNPTGNPTVIPTATTAPLPTPELVPTPTPAAETSTGLNSPLAIGVLVAMLVLIVVAGIAAYLFVLKPK